MIYLPRKEIEEQVDKLMRIWNNEINGVEKARLGFKKLFLKYNGRFANIEEERLVLHNLCNTEIDCGFCEDARIHTEILLNDMEKIDGYSKNKYTACDYCKALNNYIETHQENMSKDELIRLYELCDEIYCKYPDCSKYGELQKVICKLNLNFVKEKFDAVFEIIITALIHNEDSQYIETLNYCLDVLKEKRIDLYEKIVKEMNNNIIKIG